MNRSELRWSMSAGIAFVVLLVAGASVSFAQYPDVTDVTDTEAGLRWVDTMSSQSNRVSLLVGSYLMVLAGMAFAWFSHGLRAQVSAPAGRLVSALGVLGAGAVIAGAMSGGVVAGTVAFGGEPVPQDGGTIRIFMNLTYMFVLLAFGLICAALIATVAVAGLGSGLPRWLLYSGWLAVIGGVFGVLFVTMALPLLWFLAVTVIVLGRTAPETAGVPGPRERMEESVKEHHAVS